MIPARYPAYRDSGVEWLGLVPSHWQRPRKLGEISSLKGRLGWQGLKADEYSDEGPFVVSSAHFSNFKIRWDECPRVSQARYELDDNIQLCAGDTLLMKDGAALGKLAFVDALPGNACLNSHLLLFRPVMDGLELTYWPKFAFYYLQTTLFQEFMQTRGTGATFMGVSQDTISRHQVCWPSYSEQRVIASYLDVETAKIDALVEEQERLIELLKEKRQAVISQAVTKGLDPNVPMKDSGVEWLGEVPAHWNVSKLKHLTPQVTVGIVVEPSKYYVDFGVPALRSLNVRQEGVVVDGMICISEEGHATHKKSRLRTGDLVAVRSGQPGTTAVIPDELDGCNCIDLIVIRKPIRGSGRFLCWFMNSDAARIQYTQGSGGAIQQHFNVEAAANLLVAWPPAKEQETISNRIAAAVDECDRLIEQANLGVALLTERRSALISAAVTGKIDVRKAA